jgi:hypothetical protein
MKTTLTALAGVTALTLALIPAGTVAAIDVPQTRQEFVGAVAAGRGATRMETFVVERDLAAIYGLLERKTSPCLDVEVRRSGHVGTHREVSSSDYNPTLRRTGRGRAEFTLQVAHRPRGVGHTPPPGGLYVLAADLKALGAGRTEVTLYRPTIGFKPILRSLRQWVAGEEAACPKLK